MLNQCSQRTRRRSFSCVVDLCMRLLDSSGCGAPSLMEFKLPASNTTVCGLQIGAVKTVCIQHSLISHVLYSRSWIVGLLIAYTAAMYILYTVAPLLYRMASSAYYNLSLLSSDFYGLLFGLFLFVRSSLTHCFLQFNRRILASITSPSGSTSLHLPLSWSALSFTSGLRHVSNVCPDSFDHPLIAQINIAEEQGKLDPRAPAYVQRRGDEPFVREDDIESNDRKS